MRAASLRQMPFSRAKKDVESNLRSLSSRFCFLQRVGLSGCGVEQCLKVVSVALELFPMLKMAP